MEILGCIGMIVVFIVGVIANGWAFSVLWGWFMTPVFNLPPLSIVQAIGVSMIVSYLTVKKSRSKDTTNEELVETLIFAIFYPIMAVVLGYIVHSFM